MAELRYLACGDTQHDLARLVAGHPRQRRTFPAGAFLCEDGARRILFDTGYAPEPWHAGAAAGVYRRLLPPRIGPGETVDARLHALGVAPESITHVVLSHLHPDHIGGVRFFPQAAFVLSAQAVRALAAPRPHEGVLRRLLPPWWHRAERIVVADFAPGPYGLRTARPFGDGAVTLVDLPGHARGHLGALVEGRAGAVLLAGDAAWGRDLLGQEERIRALPRAISHDARALAETARLLLAVERAGVRLVFSHDPYPNGAVL